MDRMTPLDAAFLEAEDEDERTSMAIASIAVFDGAPPTHSEIFDAYRATLPLIPRYRQRVRRIPWDLGAPIWVDDPDFDLSYHLRRTALPRPGADADLYRLMARVMAQRLDRERPPWEAWVVEGLEGGHWALISKVHHCMVDGVSGTELYHLLLSTTAAVEPLPATPDWLPAPEPSTARLVADALRDLAVSPVRQAQMIATAARTPRRIVSRTADVLHALPTLGGALVPVDRNSLLGPTGRQRRYSAVTTHLPDVKLVGRSFGVTVNDVALAAATSGFRALLESRGEVCAAHSVRTLVPVSVRAPGEEGEFRNRVSCLLPFLPIHLTNPIDQLLAVHRDLQHLKEVKEAETGELLTEWAEHQPFAVVSPFIRTAFRLPQRNIVTVTTNVPGPRQRLYLLGRPLLRLLPYVPIADGVRYGVAILSYCDELVFGVTGDYDTAADVELLTKSMSHAIDALVSAAGA